MYLNHYSPYIQGVTNLAETMSLNICEICGNKGSVTSINGRIQTLCKTHYEDLRG